MPGRFTLTAEKGPLQGQVWRFDEPDIFVFGRGKDCHARLPEDDPTASRHHFILDINPPGARIRDLGSLNGTFVNETKCGGRDLSEAPEEATHREFPEVELEDCDKIRVGATILSVEVHRPAWCHKCHKIIPDKLHPRGTVGVIHHTCPDCERKAADAPGPLINWAPEHWDDATEEPVPLECGECGKEVSDEVGEGRQGDYICDSCREAAQDDPLEVLIRHLMERSDDAESTSDEFPGYSIEKVLGSGGMGKVYLARRKEGGEQVAIKVMLSRVAVDERERYLFLRNVDVKPRLAHPNCVGLYESGSVGPAFYCVLEYCPGGSVDMLMTRRGGSLNVVEAGPIMLDSLAGLAHIHQQGGVHRGLKPHNILLTDPDGGVAKITSFGLSEYFERMGFAGGPTRSGMVAGTPYYMPREQITNFRYSKPVTDIWSMGATFYHMLTGRFALDFPPRRDPIEVILSDRPVPIRKRDNSVSTLLAEVIDRSLAVEAVDRYQTAAEFRDALQEVLTVEIHRPEKPRPLRCSECGKDVSDEVGEGRQGDYVCNSCRSGAQEDPLGVLLRHLMEEMGVPDSTPSEFPGYSIERTLGKGGMGKVYLARREEDGKPVAIKVMLSQVAVDGGARRLFLRNMDVMSRLDHPNCVKFYESGSAGPALYFVLEYCSGGSIAGLVERRGGSLPVNEAGPIMLQSLAGLAHIHQQGIVHRDLKPHNILLTGPDGGVAKITSFDLSKSFERNSPSHDITGTGMFAGTPHFMPREQITNYRYSKPVTDIWSMGATFYCMLTGSVPLDFPRHRDAMEVILNDRPVPIRKRSRSVPKPLANVIDRSLAVETADRYQTADEFRDALQAVV